jgi:periplasmic protein TonB
MAFEAILSNQRARPKGWQRTTLVVSVVLHAAALVAGIVHSIWQVEEMPMPSLEVMLAEAPPPPPPPPPPAAKKASDSRPKTRPLEPKPQDLVVPRETPKDEPKPEESSSEAQDDGQPGGVAGGVVGGVAGGVVGGVVGAPAPPPPPPKPAGPKMLSAKLGRGQLLIDPNDERYRVKLPPPLARSGETYVAMLKVCVSAQGSVTSVQLMKSATPAIDGQFPSVIGRWRYRPLVSDGVPTPFCYPLRYEVSGR